MKICPACQKTYTDDGLNFCLEDGSILTITSSDLPETVMINQPRTTSPGPTMSSSQSGMQTSWDQQNAPYSIQPQPKKGSKAWIWVLGILGLLVLLCGGGFVGLFAYLSTLDTNSVSNSTPTPSNSVNNTRKSPTPGASPFDSTKVQTVNLAGWVQENSTYGNTEFTGGELIMSAKNKDYYYVLVAQKDYVTEGATTRVTVRNVDNVDSGMGYGLVFHSNPTPLEQGYAFLIDTKKKRYRVVRHTGDEEPVVVKWTNSDAIKDGTQENVLEAKDTAGNVGLSINGVLVTSITNTYGYKNGVPGLYSGDGIKAAFSKLEIVK